MSQTLDASARALREAFYVLSTAQDVPDAKLLDDLVRRYPQFSEELTEFAISVAVDVLHGDRAVGAAEAAIDPHVLSPAVSRAMSHFQNRLHALTTSAGANERGSTHSKAVNAPNPFLSLTREQFRAFAGRLDANAAFVSKLRDRQVDPTTMTAGFRRRVADELGVPLDVVVAHFAAEQVITPGQFYKSEGKPSTSAKQTFEEAVKHSGLSETQQRSLLDL